MSGRSAWTGACLAAGLSWAAIGAYARAPGTAAATAPGFCDRACLIRMADSYMDALVAHDPSRVHWARGARYTENSVTMKIGDGEWNVVTARSANAQHAADPVTGNVAWYGTVDEHGEKAYYAMRLKVVGGAVAEAEALITRKGHTQPFGDPARYQHDAAFSAVLPAAERVPRQKLVELANGYFSTIQGNDGTLHTSFDPDCARQENGVVTTSGNYTTTAQGCEAPLRLGVFHFVDQARARRFPIVDVERGVVVAAAYFDHGARFEQYRTTDGKVAQNPIKSPSTIGLLEMFKIRSGRIYRIEAVFNSLPYRMGSEWGGASPGPQPGVAPKGTGG